MHKLDRFISTTSNYSAYIHRMSYYMPKAHSTRYELPLFCFFPLYFAHMPPSCKQGHYLVIGAKQSRQFVEFPAAKDTAHHQLKQSCAFSKHLTRFTTVSILHRYRTIFSPSIGRFLCKIKTHASSVRNQLTLKRVHLAPKCVYIHPSKNSWSNRSSPRTLQPRGKEEGEKGGSTSCACS